MLESLDLLIGGVKIDQVITVIMVRFVNTTNCADNAGFLANQPATSNRLKHYN